VKEVICSIRQFLYETATGERLTLARWMRQFVDQHPDYAHNSILTKRVMDDLLIRLSRITTGETYEPNFKNIFSGIEGNSVNCEGLKPLPEQVALH
jgi:hypothetical protein